MKRAYPSSRPRGFIWSHLWLVLLATSLTVGVAAVVASSRPDVYTSTAEVVLSPEKTTGAPLRPDMGTERAIAQSGQVADRARASLADVDDTVSGTLSVEVLLEASVLRVSYSASTPHAAQLGASAYADAYVGYRNATVVGDVATLVTSAGLPSSAAESRLPLLLAVALLAGLTLGVGAAWTWDRLSDRVRTAAELEQRTGLPDLMSVPTWNSRWSPLPPAGPAHVAFAYVAARLASTGGGRASGRTVLVTSPRPGAGTTTVACGTAVALAGQGRDVVLVAAHDQGLRPEQALGVRASPGLRELLSGDCSVAEACHPTAVPNLRVIPAGVPGERLELENLELVVGDLGAHAFVVIDAPSLLGSADSLLLADLSDLVVLVGDLRRGRRSDVRDAYSLLRDVGPRLAGWVANRPPRHGWGADGTATDRLGLGRSRAAGDVRSDGAQVRRLLRLPRQGVADPLTAGLPEAATPLAVEGEGDERT
jgi:Mrp family chromosome partitioning ATPase